MSNLFWNVDVNRLDVARAADFIVTRVLERGRMVDVDWALAHYGIERIDRFFREAPGPRPLSISSTGARTMSSALRIELARPFRASSGPG